MVKKESSDKKVLWKDPKTGGSYGIAYSTEVQEKLLRAMEANAEWRYRTYNVLLWIKWMLVVGIVLAVVILTYLNSRNALTVIGQRLFCGA